MIASWSLLVTATDATRWRQSYGLSSLFEPQNCRDERMMELALKLAATTWTDMRRYETFCNTPQHSAEEPRLCRSVAYSWAVLHADPRVVWTALNWVYRMGKFQEYWLTDVDKWTNAFNPYNFELKPVSSCFYVYCSMRRMRFELTLLRVKAMISDLIPSWTELLNVSLLLINNNIDTVVYMRYVCNILYRKTCIMSLMCVVPVHKISIWQVMSSALMRFRYKRSCDLDIYSHLKLQFLWLLSFIT